MQFVKQQALLKIIEGTVANVPPQGGRKHPHQDFLTIDTRNILFICGGAFVGLDDMVQKRLGSRTIGFDRQSGVARGKVTKQEILRNVIPDDLMKFGLIPEFVGRIPVLATLDDLDVATLKQIFSEPKNSILKQYQKMFEMENVKLKFTDEAITRIADEAIKREAGARGLRSIVEKIMMDLMYDIPGNEDIDQVVITPQVIESGDQPVFTYRKDDKKKEKEKKEKFA